MKTIVQTNLLPWWRRMGRNPLAGLGAALLAFQGIWQIAAMLPGRAGDFDFSHYYVGTRMILEGANPYRDTLAPWFARFGFRYVADTLHETATPLFFRAFSPLALLPPRTAYVVCVGVQLAALAALLWLTRGLLAGRLSRRGWWFLCAGTLASSCLYWHFYACHLELVLAALVLAAWRWHRQGHHTLACLAVTAAGLAKLAPLVLLPWFIWRSAEDWRGRVKPAAWVAGFAALLIVATGSMRWLELFGTGMAVVRDWTLRPQYFSYSVPSLVVTLNWMLHGMHPTPEAMQAGWQVAQLAGLAVLAIAYAICLRRNADEELAFCLLSVAMLAGGGLTWGYYFVFLIFPVAVAAARIGIEPTLTRVLGFAAILLLLNDLGTKPATGLASNLYVRAWLHTPAIFGLLGLGWLFVSQLRRRRSP